MKKLKDIKKKFTFGFFFNKKYAYLNMRKSYSNFFFTLTDKKHRVIVCHTAAMVLGKLERRRRRKAPQTIEYMIASLDKYFLLYNINGLKLILHIRPGYNVINLVRSLQTRNICLIKILNRRVLPFSTTRGRRKKY